MSFFNFVCFSFFLSVERRERVWKLRGETPGDLCRSIDLRRIREAAAQIMLRSSGPGRYVSLSLSLSLSWCKQKLPAINNKTSRVIWGNGFSVSLFPCFFFRDRSMATGNQSAFPLSPLCFFPLSLSLSIHQYFSLILHTVRSLREETHVTKRSRAFAKRVFQTRRWKLPLVYRDERKKVATTLYDHRMIFD